MKNSIEIKKVSKKYPLFTLDQVDMEIPKGSIVGLIGENGAGKTTLIKSILGTISIDSGEIRFADSDFRENLGVVLDDSFFPEILKVGDIPKIMRNLYSQFDMSLFTQYLQQFHISNQQVIKTLSKGMRKKLEITTALAHHPKVLILDEPTSGLDPVVRNEILDLFLDFIQDEEHSILLSSHITSDLEHIADYITFIHDGKIVLSRSKDDIIDRYGVLHCREQEYSQLDSSDVVRVKRNRYQYDVLIENRQKFQKKYPDLVVDRVTLDDMMLLYVKGEER